MSQGWWNSLCVALVCWSLACSNSDTPANNSTSGGQGAGKEKDGAATLMPPEPDDGSGTLRITDKAGVARTNSGGEEDPFQNAKTKELSPVDKDADRKTFTGKWILVLTRPSETREFFDFHAGILEITNSAETPAKWIAESGILPPSTLKSAEINGKSIHLTLNVGDSPLDFQGTLKNGIVLGSAMLGNCLPARLLPTTHKSLDGFNPAPEPDDVRSLNAAFSIRDHKLAVKAIKKFIDEHSESPMSMVAWDNLVMIAAANGGTTEEIEALANDYIAAMAIWGPRLQQAAECYVGIVLANTQFDPDFSLKYVAAADKAVTDETLKDLKEQLKTARETIQTARALKLVESDDSDRAKTAYDFLIKVQKKSPFDPAVLYGLARFHEKAKQIDEALEFYGQLATLPSLEGFLRRGWSQKPDGEDRESPSESLVRLWEAKTGKADGLDEFKDSIYHKYLLTFADKQAAEKPAGGRIVLCELFTGATCPPCVGADIATGALEVTYPKSQVILLRYHQHIPGPDPLTNADSEDRFSSYYHLNSTPQVLLNGAPVNNPGGFTFDAPNIYKGLRTLVDQQLESKPLVKVRLNAKIEGNSLRIAADVLGLDQLKEDANDVRLRVVIAEDEINYLAFNGIRSHEMIVRRIVSGPEGAGVKDGKLVFSDTVSLDELKKSLAKYLKDYEDTEGRDFASKPLDLKRLHVVAFLQNDESHEVLQTNAISVVATGSTAATVTPANGSAPVRTSSKKEKSID